MGFDTSLYDIIQAIEARDLKNNLCRRVTRNRIQS
jgi:hypothetical protein